MSTPKEALPRLGPSLADVPGTEVDGSWVVLGTERFYRISNVDRMAPFLMSLVSDSDHWLFVSSNGGLTAGRRDADLALFPYSTEDKIEDNAANTGSRTFIWAERRGGKQAWEPFSPTSRRRYRTTTNLSKNVIGNKLLYEEINHDLGLAFRTLWTTSDRFGFVKQSEVANIGTDPVSLSLLDGVENLLPWGTTEAFQSQFSCLADAYKQNELDEQTGLGIYAFSSIPGDSAEPHEALRATVCWSTRPPSDPRLLSSTQLNHFRHGGTVEPETRVCGQRGAYFVHTVLSLPAGEQARWQVIADVAYNHSDIAALRRLLTGPADLARMVQEDVETGTRNLERIVASADGLQLTGDPLGTAHHFSNVLFNVLRGGIFEHAYRILADDLEDVVRSFNRQVGDRHRAFFAALGGEIELHELLERARESHDPDLVRLVHEYLPLSFSRRHGDPSRPWNKFSIAAKERTGRRVLGYEGNWRDIFQNWEALCHSFPEFVESVICKFVNTSTADGYNPYRITKKGYEWEVPSADEPWANIGYWGDHQLIYLLKLLEMSRDFHPARLDALLTDEVFVYADVPYDLKPYADLLRDPRKSIVYDLARERAISARESSLGLDGRYVVDRSGRLCRANLTEKLLVPLLAKVSNFIVGAGFWMNTQRPEWNDANNALTGYGVSMVTLCYARRYVSFCLDLLRHAGIREVRLNAEVGEWFDAIRDALHDHRAMLAARTIDDLGRRSLLDRLGAAAERYRTTLYAHGLCGQRTVVAVEDLTGFYELLVEFFDHTISLSRRSDGLYHAYNVMTATADGVAVGRLQEMLEGQVAVLSSGCLEAGECVSVLEALRSSRLYRADQHSYTLYPDRRLPGFLEKNIVPSERVLASRLLRALLADGNTDLIEQDVDGNLHFNSGFQNVRDLTAALARLAEQGYAGLVADEEGLIAEIFESVFRHREFTGRSGTFYGYEGLGCIYWHMVSKLLLAVHECCLAACGAQDRACRQLVAAYHDIRAGLGFNKPPAVYGAFPTDPYSHTPGHGGARQPGMTGQVKEEIITRWAELGQVVREGEIRFEPVLLRPQEFLDHPETFEYVDVGGRHRSLCLEPGALAFTRCQTLFVVRLAADERVVVRLADGTERELRQPRLGPELSREIFGRTGRVERVDVFVSPDRMVGRDSGSPPASGPTVAGEVTS